jgi:excinuclease ABC subunit B
MYADRITDSMQRAIDETYRRRAIQEAYNREHGITPQGIKKAIKDLTDRVKAVAEERAPYAVETQNTAALIATLEKDEVARLLKDLERQMKEAAKNLEFERAALIRDQIVDLRRQTMDDPVEIARTPAGRRG